MVASTVALMTLSMSSYTSISRAEMKITPPARRLSARRADKSAERVRPQSAALPGVYGSGNRMLTAARRGATVSRSCSRVLLGLAISAATYCTQPLTPPTKPASLAASTRSERISTPT